MVMLALLLTFSLCGCSLLYEYTGGVVFDLGYSKTLNKAFFADYNWDGTEEGMSIILPDRYNKTIITGLGGYTGRGYPSPFRIRPTDEAREMLCPNATEWSYISHTAYMEDYSLHYLPFKLHINTNIKEIENLSMGGIIIAEYDENGEERCNVYVLTCYVTCDETNKTFYAKDGKLYYRKDDTLVEGITYEDFDLDEHNERNKDAICIRWTC